ncbi:MAG: fibronectin type III domain-containing protein [Ardenticatenia bacterium]|nr:fibronectin type III domain-containing protein [Ardenticatenia bacterium]
MQVSGTNLVLAHNRAEAGSGKNRWGGGGGIFAQDAEVIINYATIVSNSVLSTMVAPAVIALHNFTESRVRISNSIIAFHPTSAYPRAAVISQKEGDVVILENVVFWENAGGNASTWFSGAVLTVTNQIEGDPKLSTDFHLQKGSVAIDQVSPSSYYVTDIDGEPRPFGEKSDIGADEYVPIYLSVTPLDGALFLRWNTNTALVKGVSHYQIHICEKSTSNCTTLTADSSASSYLLSNLTNYQRYLLRVDALDANSRLIESSNTVEAFPTDRFVFLPLIARGVR